MTRLRACEAGGGIKPRVKRRVIRGSGCLLSKPAKRAADRAFVLATISVALFECL